MNILLFSALAAFAFKMLKGQSDGTDYRAYNREQPMQSGDDSMQNKLNTAYDNINEKIKVPGITTNTTEDGQSRAGRCGVHQLDSRDMPLSYNDRSSGFFVDMGLILTDYYGLTSKISKLQMHSIARTFTAPVHSFAKAQKHQSTQTLFNSVVGLLQILSNHTVNNTYLSPSEWKHYSIDRRVFSPMQVNDLLRARSRLLKLAQERDNGSDEVIKKEIAVRKMQLKIFQAKGPDSMNSIIAPGIRWRTYRKRFAAYMWNICAHTDDRDTIRQVRNHFAYWLSTGKEDKTSEDELNALYETGDSSAFFYPEGFKLGITSAIYAFIGAAAIGLLMSA